MPSVHDPEMRHGRKSAQHRSDGHKAQIAVDTESQLITAVDVVAGNAPDNRGALGLVGASERDAAAEVSESVADCAYGDGATRQAFADPGRALVAKVAVTRNGACFPKTDFTIDLDAKSCICPAGRQGIACNRRPTAPRERRVLRGLRFRAEDCTACPLRLRCVRGRGARTIAVHPQEALIQQARALQASPDFAPYRRARQAAEHRLARLVQLGIRQARYWSGEDALPAPDGGHGGKPHLAGRAPPRSKRRDPAESFGDPPQRSLVADRPSDRDLAARRARVVPARCPCGRGHSVIPSPLRSRSNDRLSAALLAPRRVHNDVWQRSAT